MTYGTVDKMSATGVLWARNLALLLWHSTVLEVATSEVV